MGGWVVRTQESYIFGVYAQSLPNGYHANMILSFSEMKVFFGLVLKLRKSFPREPIRAPTLLFVFVRDEFKIFYSNR